MSLRSSNDMTALLDISVRPTSTHHPSESSAHMSISLSPVTTVININDTQSAHNECDTFTNIQSINQFKTYKMIFYDFDTYGVTCI